MLDLLVVLQNKTTMQIRQKKVNSKRLKRRYLSLARPDTEGKGPESYEKAKYHGMI